MPRHPALHKIHFDPLQMAVSIPSHVRSQANVLAMPLHATSHTVLDAFKWAVRFRFIVAALPCSKSMSVSVGVTFIGVGTAVGKIVRV